MAFERSLFSRIQEQEGDMTIELVDDATYFMRGVGSISFQIASCDVVKLSDILFVSSLRKKLLSFSCMIDIHGRVSLEGQHCNMSHCSLANPRALARRVREGDLHR